MIEPGTYTIPVEILPDGTFKFNLQAIKPGAKKTKTTKFFKDHWKPDAPFSFEFFVGELKRQGVLSENKEWRKQLRGGKQTSSFEVVGCYECLLDLGCLPLLSWPKVMEIFNDEFATEIKSARVLQTKRKTHSECNYFGRVFAFENRED